MIRYIDKGTAIQHLTDMLMKTAVNCAGFEVDAGELLRYIAEDRLPVWIDDLQIYELEEVMHGRWIREPNCYYRCSVCGDHHHCIKGNMDYKYCPNCGAKMDEE